jgi:hypothetical protein
MALQSRNTSPFPIQLSTDGNQPDSMTLSARPKDAVCIPSVACSTPSRKDKNGDTKQAFIKEEGSSLGLGKPRRRIIYARVSSAKQKDDLEREKEELQTFYPEHELITDIGSGLNFKRPGFQKLLACSLDGISKRLWSCTETDSHGSHSTSSTFSLNEAKRDSWFTMKRTSHHQHLTSSQTISSPSSMYLWLAKMDYAPQLTNEVARPPKIKQKVNPKRPDKVAVPMKARKMRIYPTNSQKALLRKWMHTARWTYNECVFWIEHHGVPVSAEALRPLVIKEDLCKSNPEFAWVLETPSAIRDDAMMDVIKAYKTGFANLKAGHIKFFKMGY